MKPFQLMFLMLLLLSAFFGGSCSDSDKQIKEVLNQELEVVIPVVPFCEIIQNFAKYEGQKIETSAILVLGYHGYFLTSPDCQHSENTIWFSSEDDSIWNKINQYTEANQLPTNNFAEVETNVIGKLERNPRAQTFEYGLDISVIKEIKPHTTYGIRKKRVK